MEDRKDKDFIDILRDHGLAVTYQRLAIYQTLCKTKEHPSAETIYQQIMKRFPMISLATVYKTMERFHEAGLIQKVSPVADIARYDAITSPHHHFVCVKCQAIKDAVELVPENIVISETHGFHVLHAQVVLQGYCPRCKPRALSK